MSLSDRYSASFPRSRQLYEQAPGVFPNGVTHDVRYMEPFPIYVDRAQGGRKWDVDGHELIDFVAGHGALLLGHGHPAVVAAVRKQMERGTHFGACHESEIEWGKWVQRLVPSAERVRFVSSGTEATLMALRLSRLFTNRPRVLKFAGHFHGWHDFLVSQADAPFDGKPTPGVAPEIERETIVIPPNDAALVEKTLRADARIGCVILEPTGGHWGAVPIRGPFLRDLREITAKQERLLIFDEVISGFRVSPGGAQAQYGIKPDLTTLAKILAGGLPGGCVAGRADILAGIEVRSGKPKMKHPGTFNGNPLSAAAGIATLQVVADGEPCRRANEIGRQMRHRLNEMFVKNGYDWLAYGEFSGFHLLPRYTGPRADRVDFIPYNGDLHKLNVPQPANFRFAFRQAVLMNGIDLFGLGGMTTAAHTEADVEATVKAVATAVELLRAEGLA